MRSGFLGLAFAAALMTGASAQTLTIGVRGGPDSIDPHFTATGTHAEALKHVFDTLVWSGDGLELEPRLAESWKVIDANTWEFKLRKGVKFHDGSDFTAEDVKFSIERIPMVAGPNPTTIYVRRVKEVKIVDPLTVHIVTDGPAPILANDFIRLFIVSSKAAAGLTKESANEAFNSGKAAVGTGPYKYVSWQPKGDLVLDRFDGYWGPKEPWARHVRKEIPNDAARVAQLKAGQLDLITRVPATDLAALRRDPKLSVQTIDTVYVFNVELDMREKAINVAAKDGSALDKNPFLDVRVREAIDMAIDRKTLAEIAMEGLGQATSQMVTPSIFGFNKTLGDRKYDPAAARKLLADAGYPNGFKLQFSFTQDRLPGDRQVGTSIAQMLAGIGIDAQANAQPAAVFFPARTRGEYSMSMSGWGTLTGEAHYTLSSLAHSNDKDKKMGAFNVLGYKNAEMDKLLQDAAVEMDEGKRRKQLEDANALVLKDRQRLPIVAVGSAWAMQKDKVTIKARVDEDTLAMNIKPGEMSGSSGIALGLHGGCGTLDRSLMSEAEWAESRAHIADALRAGWEVLSKGGRAIDAVQATVVVLENSPHFNAGYGAALTEDGHHELDASIMDGETLKAGAVAGVTRIRNPVKAARSVLESGRALLLIGSAADEFAQASGLDMVKPDYFTTQRRIDALASLKQRALAGTSAKASEAEKHGTVGAVARDANGHLAAATSTGGFNNKPKGRVGDSPIVGAGTYARDGICAVSCTGMGEIFIRRVAAYDVAARILYAKQSLDDASRTLVFETLASHGIGAGMIVLGAEGDPLAPYNTLGMYRGWIGSDREIMVGTHAELHQMGSVT